MSLFGKFLLQLLRHIFSITNKIRVLVSLTFFVTSSFGILLTFPTSIQNPILGSVIISISLLSVLIIGAFLAWRDVISENKELERQIRELKNTIPHYEIVLGVPKRFSIDQIFEAASQEMRSAKRRVDASIKARADNLHPMLGHNILQSLINVEDIVARYVGGEKTEEKHERLKAHLGRLKAYKDKARITYLLPITFTASRPDNNIDIEVRVAPDAILILENQYIHKNIPKTHSPRLTESFMFAPPAFASHRTTPPNIRSSVHENDDTASSEIEIANSKQRYPVFNRELYVTTTSGHIKLECVIHSQKRYDPQIIKLDCKLMNVVAEELSDSEQ